MRTSTFITRSKPGSVAHTVHSTVENDSREILRYASLRATELGSPQVLILSVPPDEEGTIPFVSHFYTAASGENYRAKKRKAVLYSSIRASELFLSSPLSLLTAPPPAEGIDIPFFTRFETAKAGENYRVERELEWRQLFANFATIDAPGRSPLFLPAATYTTDSCQLLSEIQQHLLETPNAGLSWSLWTADEVRSFLNHRISRFLVETGILRSLITVITTAGNNEYPYPPDLIKCTRAAFNNGTTRTPLTRMDPHQADYAFPGWESTSSDPVALIEYPGQQLSFRLVPPPSVDGQVELIYVAQPETIGAACVPLPLPNLFTPFLKWGVISDMLMKEGEANDPVRAKMAENLFQMGIELGKLLQGSFK